ncbi:MAG: PTS sugar transporter subunit IIA [Thermodesulfobacteriota bacterium]|nr:PTS sugar transporter subunit IIA [Thermodesulfobacteriota bacterium]
MKLLDIMKKGAILPELAARHKKEALEELCAVLAAQEGLDAAPLLEVLLEREKLGSTGIGEGIAIPHGKTGSTDKLLVACGRSHEGVDFDSMDGKPTHIFFLLLAPENTAGAHLKALAKISRLLKDSSFRRDMLDAPGAPEIYDLIVSRDDDF